jgi:hypothetical protein
MGRVPPPPPRALADAPWNRGRHPLLHTPTAGQVLESRAPYAREQHEGRPHRTVDRRRFIQPLELWPEPPGERVERSVEELWAEYQATTPPELRESQEEQ